MGTILTWMYLDWRYLDELNPGGIGFLGRVKNHHLAEPLAPKARERLLQAFHVLLYHLGPKSPVWTRFITLQTQRLRHIENHGDRWYLVLLGKLQEGVSSLRAHVGGVYNR